MKKYVLLSSLITSTAIMTAKADTIDTLKDDVAKESKDSSEALKCTPVAETTVAPTMPALSEKVEVTNTDVEVPLNLGEEKSEVETEVEPSYAEKLKAYRSKLEERNLVLLEKKLELIRLHQEMALLKNLEKSMNQTLSEIDKL